MFPVERDLAAALRTREERGLLRNLREVTKTVDFSSNDYLGFARSETLYEAVRQERVISKTLNGSGGSRLLSGNSHAAEQLEAFLAGFHKAPAALLFNSGYDANVGLFSSVPSKNDTIIYDELIHASVRDGIGLSHAQSFPFRHNDKEHLQARLNLADGNVFVAVESVYSMDGDFAPLKELSEICIAGNAHLIVDEAHATGVFHRGLVQQHRLEQHVFARVHTFGKALGCHGAVVAGSETLKQYLVNHARSFIYTTALPPHSLIGIRAAYRLLEQSNETIKNLHDLIGYFREKIAASLPPKEGTQEHHTAGWEGFEWLDSTSPIQSLLVRGNANAAKMAQTIQDCDIDVRPILSPTVSRGKERIRICLHVFNTQNDIDRLFEVINSEAERGSKK